MARSAYDLFRSRIAPVAFVIALILLATHTCQSEPASVTFYFDFGGRGAPVRVLEVEMLRGDDPEPVANFKEHFSSSRPASRSRWKLKLDGGTYRLRIRVETAVKTHRLERTVKVTDGAAITVPLADALPAP
jgi:hypothetical protein